MSVEEDSVVSSASFKTKYTKNVTNVGMLPHKDDSVESILLVDSPAKRACFSPVSRGGGGM